jgi:heme/copper-type cytochrome/quinol oxidase subunit 2
MHFFQVYLMVGAIVFLGVAFAVAYWLVKTSRRDDTRHR